ncbi:MAG: hypothetical protein E7267_08190 [Lachnospiraceae bacterium]|nr:hypothetical protein [Lachnospiraceae bacterium]
MNYKDCLDYLNEIDKKYGISPGTENVAELFGCVKKPYRGMHIIHVAGTNGKGSVSSFITYMLNELGYKVGRYVSPVTDGYREKIQYMYKNKVTYISEDEVAQYITALKPYADVIQNSAFEIETVMAFMAFKEWECDYIVLECGLGGLYDATNAIEEKDLCVFTSISEDHKAYLGDDVCKIAENKSGIMRYDTCNISSAQKESVKEVLCKKAKENRSSIIFPSEYRIIKSGICGNEFEYDGEIWETKLCGTYQIDNAVTAIEAVKALFRNDSIDVDKLKKGLVKTVWNNRFQIVQQRPYVVIDGAHNPDAAAKLACSLNNIFGREKYKRIGIMGVFSDKDVKGILHELSNSFDEMHIVKAPGKRGLKTEKFSEYIKDIMHIVPECHDKCAKEVIKYVTDNISEGDKDRTVVVIYGSLSLLAGN